MSLVEDTLSKPQSRGEWPALTGKGKLTTEGLPRLTEQQLAFVDALTQGGVTYTDAYLKAYPAAEKWPRNAVWVSASRTASHPKVSLWLKAAWEAKALAVNRTIEGHLDRLEKAQHKALETADRLEDRDKLNAIKVALEAEKQHAQALGLTQESKGSGGVTINLVSFAEQDQTVDVSKDGQTLTVTPGQKPDSDR